MLQIADAMAEALCYIRENKCDPPWVEETYIDEAIGILSYDIMSVVRFRQYPLISQISQIGYQYVYWPVYTFSFQIYLNALPANLWALCWQRLQYTLNLASYAYVPYCN